MTRLRDRITGCAYVRLGLLVSLSLLGVLWGGQAAAQEALSAGFREGQLAPGFMLTTLEGGQVSLGSLSGGPVFLNFWATWCPPCRKEMPDMEVLQQAMGDRIAIVGINEGEPPATVSAFVREHGYTWTFAMDETKQAGETYGVTGYPTSIFIGADGRITGRRVGSLSREEMQRQIRAAIGDGDGSFRRAVTRFVKQAKDAGMDIGSAEIESSVALLAFSLAGGRDRQLVVRNASGDPFPEALIEFQVPSFDLDGLPVSEIGEALLRWNLDYETGAWAVDAHNNRLTFVARYRGAALDGGMFQRICSEMGRAVDAFERLLLE